MSGQSAVLQVVILKDGLLVGTEVFVPGSYVIGSAPEADLRLDDGKIAAEHAVLYFENGKAAIQDSGDPVGVFVNGHRINACEVRPVDEVTCGPFALKVRVIASKPAARPARSPEVAAMLKGSGTPAGSASTQVSTRRQSVGSQQTSPQPKSPVPPSPKPKTLDEDIAATESVIVADLYGSTIPSLPPAAAAPSRPAPAQARSAPAQRPAPAPTREDSPRPKPSAAAQQSFAPSLPSVSAKDKLAKKPRLFFELYWGDTRREARSFGTIAAKKPVIAQAHEQAALPLYGFKDAVEPFVIADQHAGGYRVYVPKGVAVEVRQRGAFAPVEASQLQSDGARRFVALSEGSAVRFCEGQMALVAYVQRPLKQPFVNPLAGLPYLLIFLLTLMGGGGAAFLIYGPKPADTADFQQKNLPPVAVRLIAPEPKKKEEAKKKLEEIAAKKAAKEAKDKPVVKEKVVAKKEKAPPPSAPAESKALKALAKLSAAGPAAGDILAAVDKLGNGPGSKFVKNSNYKLSGLIGKAPIANAGLGTFGLGGGGGGGFGTKGAEILRGRGGGGIGALGAGGVGRGSVGGTVTRATARQVGVQGSIDREAVAKVVNSHLQEVRACYERALLKEPGLAGKVVLEWTIATNGRVAAAKTKTSTLRNSAVESCILSNLKGWTFPLPKGGVVIVSYPFMFNSVGY